MSDLPDREAKRREWGARLAAVRKAAGISQLAIAKLLGRETASDNSYASKIERGLNEVALSEAFVWVAACGRELDVRIRPIPGERTTIDVDAETAKLLPRIETMSAEDRELVADFIAALPNLGGFTRRRVKQDVQLLKEEAAATIREKSAEALRTFQRSEAGRDLTIGDYGAVQRAIENYEERAPAKKDQPPEGVTEGAPGTTRRSRR